MTLSRTSKTILWIAVPLILAGVVVWVGLESGVIRVYEGLSSGSSD